MPPSLSYPYHMYKNSKNIDDNDASTTVSDEIRIMRLITLPISIDKSNKLFRLD